MFIFPWDESGVNAAEWAGMLFRAAVWGENLTATLGRNSCALNRLLVIKVTIWRLGNWLLKSNRQRNWQAYRYFFLGGIEWPIFHVTCIFHKSVACVLYTRHGARGIAGECIGLGSRDLLWCECAGAQGVATFSRGSGSAWGSLTLIYLKIYVTATIAKKKKPKKFQYIVQSPLALKHPLWKNPLLTIFEASSPHSGGGWCQYIWETSFCYANPWLKNWNWLTLKIKVQFLKKPPKSPTYVYVWFDVLWRHSENSDIFLNS